MNKRVDLPGRRREKAARKTEGETRGLNETDVREERNEHVARDTESERERESERGAREVGEKTREQRPRTGRVEGG